MAAMAGYRWSHRYETAGRPRRLMVMIGLGCQLAVLPPGGPGPASAQQDTALAQRGEALSRLHCARCHVVTPENRMTGISSTPSFMIMISALEDWHERFETFLARRPHPAHLRFENEPERPPDSPATLAEVVLTSDDLEAILAYAETLAISLR